MTIANTMKSYKSHSVTDGEINQNYYNYEQYGRSWQIEAFRSLVSLRLLFVKKYLHEVVWKMNLYIIKHCLYLEIYSFRVKKNDDIHEVTNCNIITFLLHFFSQYLSIFLFSCRYFWYPKISILSIFKNIDMYRYPSKIFLSLILGALQNTYSYVKSTVEFKNAYHFAVRY